MKTKTIGWMSVCAGLALAATAQAQAQPAPGGYVTTSRIYFWPGYEGPPPGQPGSVYFEGDLGGTLQQDLIIRNAGQRVSFDPGTRGDITAGFNVTESLALEVQTGVIYNNIDTGGSSAPAFQGSCASLYQVPLLANVIFKAPLPGGMTPYVGAGFGVVATTLQVNRNDYWANDTDYTVGYQGLAGVKFAFNPHMEAGVGYRFLGTPPLTFFGGNQYLYTSTGQTFSHSIVATFTFTF